MTAVTEYGIFTDEGCIEAGIYDADEASQIASEYVVNGEYETTHAAPICGEHAEQEAATCEECYA